jgi:hypothetical protein
MHQVFFERREAAFPAVGIVEGNEDIQPYFDANTDWRKSTADGENHYQYMAYSHVVQKFSLQIKINTPGSADYIKGQPGAHGSRLRKVLGMIRLIWVLCTQSFSAFQRENSRYTWLY